MVTLEKVKRLGDAGSYDLCSGTSCMNSTMNKSFLSSVYPAVTGNGRCMNLFKTLMTNACSHDCNYCVNRRSNCRKRERYTPMELAGTFLNMKRLGYVDGLFLSSGVGGDPDAVMTDMVESVRLLRERYNFRGYVHLKVLPEASRYLVHQACALADRVSVNLESTRECLPELSGDKCFSDLFTRLSWINQERGRGLLPAGLTTQLIVGGAGESDLDVLKLVSNVYSSFNLNRVYFSTFSPLKGTPFETRTRVDPLRGHRLYQTDYLLRDYSFSLNDLVFSDGFLDLSVDPKVNFALNSKLCVDVNDASFHELLRVPGVGPKSCKRVIEYRREHRINSFAELKSLGVISERAAPFITLNGRRQSRLSEFVAY